jgi:hypothetical protein
VGQFEISGFFGGTSFVDRLFLGAVSPAMIHNTSESDSSANPMVICRDSLSKTSNALVEAERGRNNSSSGDKPWQTAAGTITIADRRRKNAIGFIAGILPAVRREGERGIARRPRFRGWLAITTDDKILVAKR